MNPPPHDVARTSDMTDGNQAYTQWGGRTMNSNTRMICSAIAAVMLTLPSLSAAQAVDTAQTRFQPQNVIQYLRPQDKRGLNLFETAKEAGAEYRGFALQWGAAFTQQFQALSHSNTADSVAVPAVAPSPGNAGSAAIANRNRLMEVGNGFNNATANMYLHAQLAPGVRVQLTSYLSARRHNETWVKDGFLQIDESPIDLPLFNDIMKYTTLKIGHFEINYGDFHFRRTDNGQALYNPFVGNLILDAFTTEVGTEAIVQKGDLFGVIALTNGEIRGNIQRPNSREPALMFKAGFDRQMSEDLRVRLSGSYRTQKGAINNTFYTGDRAGSRYYYVLENYVATETANASSGMINPGFSDAVTAYMINPFVKFRGLEFFGVYENASGRGQEGTGGAPAGVAPPERDVTQLMAELVYRFLPGERLFVGGRWNTVTGNLGGANSDVDVTRTNFGGGWWITPSLLLKAEYVNQTYDGFSSTDIRNGGRFKGFVLEAVTAF